MSQFGVGMVFAWWKFFCVLVDWGLIFWFVGVGEWDLLGLRNVASVECRYSQMGITFCCECGISLFLNGNSGCVISEWE